MYMREYWVQVHQSPIVYRYVDWSITVPLQMIEFNLILKAAGKPTTSAMFWKLLGGTVMMLSFGYLGEIGALLAWPAFAGGMLGWFFILFEIFNGEAGGTASGCSAAVASSFSTMRLLAGLQPRVTLRARERLCWVEQARSVGVLRLPSAMHIFFSDFLICLFYHDLNGKI